MVVLYICIYIVFYICIGKWIVLNRILVRLFYWKINIDYIEWDNFCNSKVINKINLLIVYYIIEYYN